MKFDKDVGTRILFDIRHSFLFFRIKNVVYLHQNLTFMKLKDRIELLSLLGKHLLKLDDSLKATILRTYHNNQWFTEENVIQSIKAVAAQFLDKDKLTNWTGQYPIPEVEKPKTVGLVMAGNIPMVGFHDWLCTFVSGHKAMVKLSEKDKLLLPYAVNFLCDIEPKVKELTTFSDRLSNMDAVIATGSNNSSRYFETYFGKYPNIIRKNRTSVAILTGKESRDELLELGKDIFNYFGLGCRNVSKIYVPKKFDFQVFMEAMHEFKELVLHHKFKNNFDYNFTLLILNKIKHYSNGCLLVHESELLYSRIASLHYHYYESIEQVTADLKAQKDEIQCIVSKDGVPGITTTELGKTQEPGLTDYADNVDTLSFLVNL